MSAPTLKNSRGFSLLEALVAVSIFVFAILAPLKIANQSIMASVSTKDQIIAMGLARDAVEYANYWRSINGATGKKWTFDFFQGNGTSLCGDTPGCKFDTSVQSGNITVNDNVPLRLDPVSGQYGYNPAWPATKYTRVVRVTGIDNINNPQIGIIVEAAVSWELAPGFIRSVKVREYLYNWVPEEKK